MTSQDLGGLGAARGPAVAYVWVPPSRMPLLLPWLGVFLLLLHQPNRRRPAWWIWLPLAAIVLAEPGLQRWLGFIPSQPRDVLCEGVEALGFGIAALWLLAPALENRSRLVTFLGMLLVIGLASTLIFAVRLGWQSGGIGMEFGLFLLLAVLCISLALTLAGWTARRTYGPVRAAIWLLIWFAVTATALATPFLAVFVWISGGAAPWRQLLVAAWVIAGVSFATLLPFLILASLNSLFGERIKELVHLGKPAPATLIQIQGSNS